MPPQIIVWHNIEFWPPSMTMNFEALKYPSLQVHIHKYLILNYLGLLPLIFELCAKHPLKMDISTLTNVNVPS